MRRRAPKTQPVRERVISALDHLAANDPRAGAPTNPDAEALGRRVGAAARAAAAAGARLPDVETAGTGLTERLSLIATEKALASVGARLEDLVDPDVRAVVIRTDHPELDRAVRDGKDELIVDGEPISIRLLVQLPVAATGRRSATFGRPVVPPV